MAFTPQLRNWTSSVPVNSLNAKAERFFVRLFMVVDPFGRADANLKLLRANCFPLLTDSVKECDIARWITECEKAGLIALYEAGSKVVLVILKFRQRLYYNSLSDFPDPPEEIKDVARFRDRPADRSGKITPPGLRGVTPGNAASDASSSLLLASRSRNAGESSEEIEQRAENLRRKSQAKKTGEKCLSPTTSAN